MIKYLYETDIEDDFKASHDHKYGSWYLIQTSFNYSGQVYLFNDHDNKTTEINAMQTSPSITKTN